MRSRWLLFGGGALVALAVIVALVLTGDDRRLAPDDDSFLVVAPRGDALRRATTLRLSFDSGTCRPGDEADLARNVNAPLRVEVLDRADAVVIKARVDNQYVASITPPLKGDCAGVGLGFTRYIRIARPIGNRALINGGFEYRGDQPSVLLPSRVKGTNGQWTTRIERLRYMGINREGHPLKPGEAP